MKTSAVLESLNNQHEFIERRHKKDWVLRSVNIITVIGWLFAIASWILIDMAKPATEYFFTRLFNTGIKSYWDVQLLRMGVGVLMVSFITCVAGFFVNMSRHRRQTDRYNKFIIILGTITFIFLTVFITKLL